MREIWNIFSYTFNNKSKKSSSVARWIWVQSGTMKTITCTIKLLPKYKIKVINSNNNINTRTWQKTLIIISIMRRLAPVSITVADNTRNNNIHTTIRVWARVLNGRKLCRGMDHTTLSKTQRSNLTWTIHHSLTGHHKWSHGQRVHRWSDSRTTMKIKWRHSMKT